MLPQKYMRVTMPDDSRWDVSCHIIARNRALDYYPDEKSIEHQEEYEYTLRTNSLIADWAQNNMNWDDIKVIAVKVQDEPERGPDYQEGWVNGEKEFIQK